MVFGFRKTEDSGYGVVVDVHSGSVGVAIVRGRPGEPKPTIIYSYRESLKVQETVEAATLIHALQQSLFAIAMQLSQEGLQALRSYDPTARIDTLMLVCGAPWAQTVTRFIQVAEKEPFTVTEEKVHALIAEAEKRDEEDMRASELLQQLDIRLVERAIVHTALNGYFVHDAYGKKATELSIAHVSGLIPQAVLDALDEMERKVLPHTKRVSHTFAVLFFSVVRDIYPHLRNTLLIDVSAEATELCIMQEEVLMETAICSAGINTIARAVAKDLHTFPDEALGHLRDYGGASTEQVRKAISRASEEYAAELLRTVAELRKRYSIPTDVCLVTGKQLEKFFAPLIDSTTKQFRAGHGTFTSIDPAVLPVEYIDHDAKEDIFFAIESRFFHTLHVCGEND